MITITWPMILNDRWGRLLPRPLPTRRPQTLSEQQSAAREELGVQEHESEQQFAAREEPGVRELESE